MLKRTLIAGLVTFVLIGCGGPPKEEIEKATKAQQAALAAKADSYAKESYEAAVASVAKGADAVKKSQWDVAKKSYSEAVKQFEAAAKAAPDAEKAAKEAAAKGVAEVKAVWDALAKDAKLTAAVKLLKKDQKATYDGLLKDAEAAVKAAEGQAAENPNAALEQVKVAGEKIAALKVLAIPAKK